MKSNLEIIKNFLDAFGIDYYFDTKQETDDNQDSPVEAIISVRGNLRFDIDGELIKDR